MLAAAAGPAGGRLAVRAGRFQLATDEQHRTTDSKGISTDEGKFGRQRFTLTFDSRVGYDDNTLGQPDTATVEVTFGPQHRQTATRSRPSTSTRRDSAFLNFALGGTYTAANLPR